MKTILEWLESIEDAEIRANALANFEHNRINLGGELRESFAAAIIAAFSWLDTPQGFEYWQDKYLGVPSTPSQDPQENIEVIKKELEAVKAENKELWGHATERTAMIEQLNFELEKATDLISRASCYDAWMLPALRKEIQSFLSK